MLLQGLCQVQHGFAQQSVCFQGVVTPYFEIHLCARCYIPNRSRTHKQNMILLFAVVICEWCQNILAALREAGGKCFFTLDSLVL